MDDFGFVLTALCAAALAALGGAIHASLRVYHKTTTDAQRRLYRMLFAMLALDVAALLAIVGAAVAGFLPALTPLSAMGILIAASVPATYGLLHAIKRQGGPTD